jgi:hypothetical protein
MLRWLIRMQGPASGPHVPHTLPHLGLSSPTRNVEVKGLVGPLVGRLILCDL